MEGAVDARGVGLAAGVALAVGVAMGVGAGVGVEVGPEVGAEVGVGVATGARDGLAVAPVGEGCAVVGVAVGVGFESATVATGVGVAAVVTADAGTLAPPPPLHAFSEIAVNRQYTAAMRTAISTTSRNGTEGACALYRIEVKLVKGAGP